MTDIREMPADFSPHIESPPEGGLIGRYDGFELGTVREDAWTRFVLCLALWQASECKRLGLKIGEALS